MKKVFLLATAACLITGVSFAGNDKGKEKKKKSTKSCCSKSSGKSCGKTTTTVKM